MRLTPDERIAGVLAPLFAIRGENDLGIGDVGCLRQFVDWAADNLFRLVQLLPINETGHDNSPYNAISSSAIDPTTLDFSALEDLSRDESEKVLAEVDLKVLRSGPVNYPVVKALKQTLLERAFANFSTTHLRRNSARARRFRAFVKEHDFWINDYSFFRVLMELNEGSERWDLWREEHRDVQSAREWLQRQKSKERMHFQTRMKFYMYVQWLAFTQWRDLKRHCDERGVALMGDVPFGVSYYSSDVFCRPELFELQWSGGAPPEPYFKDDAFTQKWGQNWGVPLYNWELMERNGFAWWRQRVHTVREIFHLFRIDHILGFYRIYCFPWRPEENAKYLPVTLDEARALTGGRLPHFSPRDDSTPENREANRRQGEKLLRVLLEEVGQYRLIGEDLGTVPEYVRPNLASLEIAGFKIPIWEKRSESELIDGSEYQRISVATYATHDHEPLRALWERWFRTIRDGDAETAAEARQEMRKLSVFAGLNGDAPQPWNDEIHDELLTALFRSNSWIAVCMITDLLAMDQRFNVPGAVAESNWSQRLPYTVNELRSKPALKSKIQGISRILREAGRDHALK